MEIDLRQVLRSARRWWWIVLLCPLLLSVLSYVYTEHKTPLYEAQAKLFVDPSGTGQYDYSSIMTAQSLTKTYEKLVKNRQVLSTAISNLQLSTTPDALAGQITAASDGDTQLLLITVSDPDPKQAAAIANEVAKDFAAYIRDTSATSGGQSLAEIDDQISAIQAQINDYENQLATLQARPDANSDEVKNQINSINSALDQLRPTYATLITTRSDTQIRQAITVDRVKVYEPAYEPGTPYSPVLKVNLMLAIIGGLLVAAGFVMLLEYLDNTVKPTTEFTTLVGGPLLAAINAVPKLGTGRKQLFVLDQPKGGAAESIRLLRTNIEFASATHEIATLAITSPSPGEGKSTVAANLAVTLAQAGFVTALVDADLRRPTQHRVFQTGNERGLSTLLTVAERPWTWAARETMVPNLTLIPAGPLPPNPADLLSLERLRQILADMRTTFDVIVVDTPPVLAVSDPLIIAAHVDGMLLVTSGGKTRLDAVKRAAETLHRGSIRLIGVVINQESSNPKDGYYYNEYHAVQEKIADSPRRRGARGASAGVDLKTAKMEPTSTAD